jgi:hypothetical protein
MNYAFFVPLITLLAAGASCGTTVHLPARGVSEQNIYPVCQITFDDDNHWLSPYGAFSPDDRWLVYDTRQVDSAMGSNPFIKKVNVETGQIETVNTTYNHTSNGPGCGTPMYQPTRNRVNIIHGPENANSDIPYDFHRRTCVMVDEEQPGKGIHLDARDISPPFTPGALRGGTHAHQFSGDGDWIGFTYNDSLMVDLENRTGQKSDLRTVGVMTRYSPIDVDQDAVGENNDGEWFAVLAARVTPHPQPGTDEIDRAFSNAWVGEKGYLKADGTWQRAQAFLGKVRTVDDCEVVEVFIVDIPDRIDRPGPDGPLEGTKTCLPMPPEGTTQRRLTHLSHRKYPGVVTEPRHWVLSSSDGQYIAFLAKDTAGIVQIFAVSPQGSAPIQLTSHSTHVQDTFAWQPGSHLLCYVCDNSLFLAGLENGTPMPPIRLTNPFQAQPLYPCWSHDGKAIAFNLYVSIDEQQFRQIFLLNLTK